MSKKLVATIPSALVILPWGKVRVFRSTKNQHYTYIANTSEIGNKWKKKRILMKQNWNASLKKMLYMGKLFIFLEGDKDEWYSLK